MSLKPLKNKRIYSFGSCQFLVVKQKNTDRFQISSENFDTPRRVHHLSETSDGSTDGSCSDFLEEVDALQEMFPEVCSIEVRN